MTLHLFLNACVCVSICYTCLLKVPVTRRVAKVGVNWWMENAKNKNRIEGSHVENHATILFFLFPPTPVKQWNSSRPNILAFDCCLWARACDCVFYYCRNCLYRASLCTVVLRNNGRLIYKTCYIVVPVSLFNWIILFVLFSIKLYFLLVNSLI